MVIHINPNRINVSTGTSGRTGGRRAPLTSDDTYKAPSRAHINFIPSPESLSTLILSAVDALKRGIRWDRGTILNLLV